MLIGPMPLAVVTVQVQTRSVPLSHGGLERHHHDVGDATVLALDDSTQSADSGGLSASVLLPVFAAPRQGLSHSASAVPNGPWPAQGTVAFDSSTVLPLLRPPSA